MVEVKKKELVSYEGVKIFEGFPYNFYELSEPLLSDDEKAFASALSAFLLKKNSFYDLQKQLPKETNLAFFELVKTALSSDFEFNELLNKLPDSKEIDNLKQKIVSLLKGISFIKKPELIAEFVLNKTVGFDLIAFPMHDPKLEEIMINPKGNVFVFHKEFGMCKTNIQQIPEVVLLPFINRIALNVGKHFDQNHALLDARLPDGSRANATFSNISPFGFSLTIRKFTKIPLSIIDLINYKTISAELAAFLWVMVEGMDIEPMNLIVTGGAGSGKTTTLNALTVFIRPRERIVTIEDTLELDLGGRENWIQLESKPKGFDQDEITMDDLLKNSLRMRPDRILVGEVRGKEAQTLFVAMDVGHQGSMGTLHSNSAKEMLLRLMSEPMAVPESMIPLLDLVIVQQKISSRDKGAMRRITHVAEIDRMDNKPLLSNVYEWDISKDLISKTTTPMHVIEKLAGKAAVSKKDLFQEIIVRQRVLEWMQKTNIRSNPDVEKIIQDYYFKPETILQKISNGL